MVSSLISGKPKVGAFPRRIIATLKVPTEKEQMASSQAMADALSQLDKHGPAQAA